MEAPDTSAAPNDEIEMLFRRESRRLISVLTRILGSHNLDLAEDVVQESFVRAMDSWARKGIPDNPSAWLLTTARNRAIDVIRRERTRRTFANDLAVYLDSEWTLSPTVDEAFEEQGIRDDQLRMIFMCCHQSLTPENRTTLILKTLCGLSVPAIARAPLTTESTINKRLYRTRRQVRSLEFVIPTEKDRAGALATVHTSLYLLFNEGYLSTSDQPILKELCHDALELTLLLAETPGLASSDTIALLAIMRFNTARLRSRLDEAGRLVPLDQQDRSLWDQELIRLGYDDLARASAMEAVAASRFHLEAAVAARHCSAPTFAETDWKSICRLYDRLREAAPSPVVELNRAVAISYRDGPEAAIPLVDSIREEGKLTHSHAVAAVLANLYARAGYQQPADAFLDQALSQARTEHEREFIAQQVRRAGSGD